MSNRILVIVLIISVAINLAVVVTLGFNWLSDSRIRRPFDHRPFDRRMLIHHGYFMKELGLTDEQVVRFGTMRKEIAEIMQPVQKEIMIRRNALMYLLKQPDPDTIRAAELINEISALQAEHERRSFQGFLKLRSILTSEQQSKMEAILNIFSEQCPMPEYPCPQVHPGPLKPPPLHGK